jgi:hypothetical protein
MAMRLAKTQRQIDDRARREALLEFLRQQIFPGDRRKAHCALSKAGADPSGEERGARHQT